MFFLPIIIAPYRLEIIRRSSISFPEPPHQMSIDLSFAVTPTFASSPSPLYTAYYPYRWYEWKGIRLCTGFFDSG
jgi:hypothetical protein